MAILREYIYFSPQSGTLEFKPLSTGAFPDDYTRKITNGPSNDRHIRIIPYGEYASTKELLEVAADLLENDRRINNEKNAGHSILCDGIFNDVGANFSIELTYDPIYPTKFKSLNIQHGKFKTNGTIYEIVEDLTCELNGTNEYKIDEVTQSEATPYRRDYISVVYFDNDAYATKQTPYWRYVKGATLYKEAPSKHQQKIYNVGDVGELWPTSMAKKDINDQPARYREYIIYSLLFFYNAKGSWQELTYTSGAIQPSNPVNGQYWERTVVGDPVQLRIYNESQAQWNIVVSNAIDVTGAYLPNNPIDGSYYKIGSIWYQFKAVNKFTELRSVEVVPNITGIADIINFVNANMIFEEKTYPEAFKLFKISNIDRELYHPYKTFTPLSFEYGQGESVIRKGANFHPSDYNFNRLMYDYIPLNNVVSSLFNFPFKLQDVENDFTLSDEVTLDSVMLGYKKEGFWNKDYIRNTIDKKYYQLFNGIWNEITLTGSGSVLIDAPHINDRYEIVSGTKHIHGIYIYNGASWVNALTDGGAWNQSSLKCRKGNVFPYEPSTGKYFEIKNTEISGINDGIYVYNGTDNRWGNYSSTDVFTEMIPFTKHASSPAYSLPSVSGVTKNTVFKLLQAGTTLYKWYILGESSGNPAWIEVQYNYGNIFPGGIDSQGTPRFPSGPQENEYFYSYGDGNCAKGWWKRISSYWVYLNVDYGDTLPTTIPADNSYFESNGLEVGNGEPEFGLYKFVGPSWLSIPFEISPTPPVYRLFDGKYFKSDGTDVSYPTGLYRFFVGRWVQKNTLSPALSFPTGLTINDDGKYFRALGSADPTYPKAGWYKYDHAHTSWDVITYISGVELPVHNLIDKKYFELVVDSLLYLYQYDANLTGWELIPSNVIGTAVAELPLNPTIGQYCEINGLGLAKKGYYLYDGDKWGKCNHTDVNGIPDLEDDFVVEVIEPLVYMDKDGNTETVVKKIYTTSSNHDPINGVYEIEVTNLIETRNYLNGALKEIEVDDCVLITDGFGKYQTGRIKQIIKTINPVNERFVVEGLYSHIESQANDMSHLDEATASKLIFFSADGYKVIDETKLTKKDAMDQIDEIINRVEGQDVTIDETLLNQKINELKDIYEIKFQFTNSRLINKFNWNFIRCKSVRASNGELSWQPPKVVIHPPSDHTIIERNGYFDLRYLTITGKYPYYGVDEQGNKDYTLKYLVIEDTCNYNASQPTWTEVQTTQPLRTFLYGFSKFKVIAKNLDDVNAPKIWTDLNRKLTSNEIYVDVIHGRMMVHPNIVSKIMETIPQYAIRISYIILNVLTGYISTDHIIHVDRKKGQTVLFNKIEEIDNSIALLKASMGGDTDGSLRRLFTYRGKWASLYQQEGRMFVALNSEGFTLGTTPATDKVFLTNTTGTAIGASVNNIFRIGYENPISIYMAGDKYTRKNTIYKKGIYKDNDYVKLVNKSLSEDGWYKHNSVTNLWEKLTFTTGYEFPLTPINGQYCEIDGTGSISKGLYLYSGTWNRITTLGIPTYVNALPSLILGDEAKYTEASIELAVETSGTDEASRKITTGTFGFSTIIPVFNPTYFNYLSENIRTHRFVGIRIKTLGAGWNNMSIVLHDGNNTQIGLAATKSYAEIASIINNASFDEVDKIIYFRIDGTINKGINYHYHIYVDNFTSGGTNALPQVLCYNDGGNVYGFLKVQARPYSGTHDEAYSNTSSIIRFVDSKEGNILPSTIYVGNDTLDEINGLTNRPYVENNSINLVIPVDFSDNSDGGFWESWDYAQCIGYDCRYGRVKLPSSINSDNIAIEFNASWLFSAITTKSISMSFNNNASLEDVFKIVDQYETTEDLMDYVDTQIARYSPKEDVFTAIGTIGETFTLSFIPSIVSNTYESGNDIKKSLFVTINGAHQPYSMFSLNNGNILSFTDTLNAGDIVAVKGTGYKVLSTIENGSITPDHFSQATQNIINELRDIRDVQFPLQIERAKEEIQNAVTEMLEYNSLPKEDIFRRNGSNIEKYNETTTSWVVVGTLLNTFPLSWVPKNKESLIVFVQNNIIAKTAFSISGEGNNNITLSSNINDGDVVIVKGNVSRAAINPLAEIQPAEDSFTGNGSQVTFTCTFLAKSKDYLDVYVEGIYQSKNYYTLTNTNQPAFANGNINMNTGFDWSVTPERFLIKVDGIQKVILLDGLCSTVNDVITLINGKFTIVGLNTKVRAVAYNTNYVRIETINNGSSVNMELITYASANALLRLGLTAGIYNGTDGVSVVTFDEAPLSEESITVKGGRIVAKSVLDGQIEYRHLSADLKVALKI